MMARSELKQASEYVGVLRPLLPPKAFAPDSRNVWRMGMNVIVVGLGYFLLRKVDRWWVGPACAVLVGHSLACLAFFAHDVSHSAVFQNKPVRRALEFLLWGLNVIPPTLWRRVHNQTHHRETNTVSDPDRQYRRNERTRATLVYTRIFYPNRETPLHHPLFLFHFVAYISRNIVASLLPGDTRPSTVPFKPGYTSQLRLFILIDLGIIAGLQYIVWICVGKNLWCYLWASPAAICVSSSVVMLYVFTNHFLNPLCEHTDPLVGSTSVIVPFWMDWLHDNFSYHTEHHVFPGINPRYYPEVSLLLQEHFPDRYNRVPFGVAWRRIWRQEEFITE